MAKNNKITVTANGPYIVHGNVPLVRETMQVNDDNIPVEWQQTSVLNTEGMYAWCRCGQSKNKPSCDGSHVAQSFDGTETANMLLHAQTAIIYQGPELQLSDAEHFCSAAGFCRRGGGTWELTEQSGNPVAKAIAIETACDCPSGRLVQRDKTCDSAIEPPFDQVISITDDPVRGVSGPLWVKGGVPIQSSSGETYEVRNRVTLCRCGQSENKPFCDGSHCDVKFKE